MDESRRCRATSKRSGERCKKASIIGGRTCHIHGSNNARSRTAAARRLLTAEVRAEAAAVLAHEGISGVDDPVELLSRVAAEVVAFKDALAARVNALESLTVAGSQDRLRAEMELYERALDRTMKAAEVLAKLDLEGRRQAAAERWGAEIAALLQAIFVELALSEQQWQRVPVVVSHHLEAVAQLPAGHDRQSSEDADDG